jgi:hypothetical protein
MAVALAVFSTFSLVGITLVGHQSAGATPPGSPDSGFTLPFSGTPQYEDSAPTDVATPAQLNQPIGQREADRLARELGLDRRDAFSEQQYVKFISGKGNTAKPADAKLADESVRILTNTVGRPLYSTVDGHVTQSVLASYGLFVSTSGTLESLANTAAPTRQVNTVIAPGGYMGTWCRHNTATDSLTALYRSAYTVEAGYGFKAQQQQEKAELVPNNKAGVNSQVGMSMAPTIWIVNFLLLYILNPSLAADMPAAWTPIPSDVATAMLTSSTGRVPYSDFASDFH